MAYSRTIFVGNITKDPELRVTNNGKSVCSFSVAVKRRRQDVTDFHDCVAWEKTAEAISKFFRKGKEILVEGELQKRSYQDKDGNKRWVTELVVDSFSFTGRKDDDDFHASKPSAYSGGFEEVEDDDEMPF